MSEKYVRILNQLYKTFSDNLPDDPEERSLDVMLVDERESGYEVPVLTTLHHDFGLIANLASGLFFFDEDPETGDVSYIARILIVPEVPQENLPELCVLIGIVNDQTPVGCFEYDLAEKTLAYSLKTPIKSGLSDQELSELCDRCTAVAMSTAEENCHDLVRCATK